VREPGETIVQDETACTSPWIPLSGLVRIELANAIFEYLEIFHNGHRRHRALGTRTPIEYETLYADTHKLACNPAS
jgi:hypothetical protein